MFRGILHALALSALIALSACVNVEAEPEQEAAALQAFQNFRDADINALRQSAANAEQRQQIEVLAQIQALLPTTEPASVDLVSHAWVTAISSGSSSYVLNHEYRWPDRAALVTVSLSRASADAQLEITNTYVRTASLDELKVNDLNLSGKSLVHYAILIAPIASVLLMVLAIAMSIHTPEVERRWLWCIVSLLTVCQFQLNWASGAFQWMLLHGGLINQGVSRGGSLFDAWVVSTSIPIGAIIVVLRLWRRGKEVREAAKSD